MKRVHRVKSNTRKNAGFTLVELLVSMTLTAIFATAIVAVMPAATRIYMQIEDMSRAQVVADMVVDSLREECADTYIEDFASVRIVSLSLGNTYAPSTGDQPLTDLYDITDPNILPENNPRINGSASEGNVLIIRKNNSFCQAIYSCMPVSYSNYTSVKDANRAEGTSYIIPNPADGINGRSSRAVYRFYLGGSADDASPETLRGYVHYGYYQCGKENKDLGGGKSVSCIYPAVRYDYTTPFSSASYNGYTVDLSFSDLEYSTDDIYTQRPVSVKVTVKVYKCDYAGQAYEDPIYTRSTILVFAEDTTE